MLFITNNTFLTLPRLRIKLGSFGVVITECTDAFFWYFYMYFFCSRAFDVEMLYLAQSLGIPIDEIAVEWNEIEGM